jgi:hypothetical protein
MKEKKGKKKAKQKRKINLLSLTRMPFGGIKFYGTWKARKIKKRENQISIIISLMRHKTLPFPDLMPLR